MKRNMISFNRVIMYTWCLMAAVVLAFIHPMTDRTCYADAVVVYRVAVTDGYLALRTAKSFDSNNEIGKLYTGDIVEVQDFTDDTYWYVYSFQNEEYGYVNKNYLVASDSDWTVRVDSGYLALRSARAFDRSNEIGKLYTGDTVKIQNSFDSTYWYVYSATLEKSGYVDKDYLDAPNATPSPGASWTVKVDSGYLALRSAKAFDRNNEIGRLYTGDVVQIQDSSDSDYWYVYSVALEKSGYVDKAYLVVSDSALPANVIRTVKVDSGYLALRSGKAYDRSNEIGKLYTGDSVEIQDSSDSTYWYVYSQKLRKYGYVNCNYLY